MRNRERDRETERAMQLKIKVKRERESVWACMGVKVVKREKRDYERKWKDFNRNRKLYTTLLQYFLKSETVFLILFRFPEAVD